MPQDGFKKMITSPSPRSPLVRLVLFMVCLAIVGTIVAGTHYYAVDLPRQKSLQIPRNALIDEQQKMSDLQNSISLSSNIQKMLSEKVKQILSDIR